MPERNVRSSGVATSPGVHGLIVTCEECSTSFQLDEARIPATGARVRCSRCKHAFFLPNPNASQSEAIDSIAEQAAGDSLAAVPAASPDLSSSALGEPPPSESTADSSLDSIDSGEPEEEEWQFSEEIRVEGDDDLEDEDELSSRGVFGTSLDVGGDTQDEVCTKMEGAEQDFSSSGFDASEISDSATDAAPARDESDFGSVDDFSSLMEEDDAAPVDLAGEIESEMQIEDSAAASTGVYASAGTTDDLGDPESWDLVGSDDLAVSKRSTRSSEGSLAKAPPSVEDSFDDDSETLAYADDVGPASKWVGAFASVGRGLGWAVTIAMVGAVLFFGLSREWNRGAQTIQAVSMGGLTATTTNAVWVETSRAGYVLVVEGQLRNDGADPLWPGTVQLALLDTAGLRLLEEPIRVGQPMSEVVLREGSAAELVATAEQASLEFRATPIAPGETRVFEAIALEDQLPEGASRMLLEMSNPGAVARIEAPGDQESGLSP